MIPFTRRRFKPLRSILAALALTGLLTSCAPVGPAPSLDPGGIVPVALLVPYGSPNAGEQALAQGLENAARLALADLEGVTLDLRVYPTAADPAQAQSQASAAVADGAKIILGPVFSASANAAGLAVAPQGVNVLSFSNNPAIAGGNVFVLGSTFDNTARRVVSFLASTPSSTGLPPSVLTVYPQTAAGEAGRAAVSGALANSNVALASEASYEASQQGIVQAAGSIAQTASSTGANVVFFTSDTTGGLPLLSQLLPENGVDPALVQYAGLTRWDVPSATLDLPGLQNGIFALPDPRLSAQFQDRYLSAYGTAPNPIAGLAYDGIAAIGALVAQGRSDALSREALTQPSGFAGVNGVFRLRSDGTNERALAVARIVGRQVQVVSPAPTSFGSAGF